MGRGGGFWPGAAGYCGVRRVCNQMAVCILEGVGVGRVRPCWATKAARER